MDSKGHMPSPTSKHDDVKKSIIFLCTGNSCRSQMAEGWARHLLGAHISAYSAGIEVHGLNPFAVQVMQEAGVDISAHTSKLIDSLLDTHVDYVVTVCDHASQHCPIWPNPTHVTVIHHSFDDPPTLTKQISSSSSSPEKALDCYRKVRDEIKDFILTLPALLELEL